MTIRDFTPDDYPATVALGNLVFSEYRSTVEQARWGDENRDPKCKWGRFVGVREASGEVIAVGDYGQGSGMYHPRKFGFWVLVHPDHQGQGYGKAMYAHVLKALEVYDPLSVRSNAREDMPRSVRFLSDRGFVEDMRYWESHLDVTAFDFAPYEDAEDRTAAQGITIRTMTELDAEDPQFRPKLYELTTELHDDVPSPEAHTKMDYEVWLKRFSNPNLIPDANFVALDGDMYVGFSNLWKSEADDHLHTGLTGVRREYRRKGIALALKLRAVRYARTVGAPVIRTGNETNNRAMLSINERLGFARQPAWLDLVLKLKEEEEETPAP